MNWQESRESPETRESPDSLRVAKSAFQGSAAPGPFSGVSVESDSFLAPRYHRDGLHGGMLWLLGQRN